MKNKVICYALFSVLFAVLSTTYSMVPNPFAQAKKDLRTINAYLRMPDHGGVATHEFRTALAHVGLSVAAITALAAGGTVAILKKPAFSKAAVIQLAKAKTENEEALLAAVKNNDLGKVKSLIEQSKTSPHIYDQKTGYTLLILASIDADSKLVEYLLTIPGIAINAKDNGGNSALLRALENESEEAIVQSLIEKDADVNQANNAWVTPLMQAAKNNLGWAILLLLEKGAQDSIDAQDIYGYTALMRAAESGSKDAVAALLTKGAKTSLVNQRNKKAIDLTKDEAIKNMLKESEQYQNERNDLGVIV